MSGGPPSSVCACLGSRVQFARLKSLQSFLVDVSKNDGYPEVLAFVSLLTEAEVVAGALRDRGGGAGAGHGAGGDAAIFKNTQKVQSAIIISAFQNQTETVI